MSLDLVEVYEKNLTRIHEWIRAVDQKLSIFLALQGLFLAIITPLVISLISKKSVFISKLQIAVVVIAYFLLICAIGKCLRSLYATLNVNKQKITEDQLSITYFKHISETSKDSYEKKMKGLTRNKYLTELLSQIHISAKIATNKHAHFNDALVLFSIGSLLLIITLLQISINT